MQDLLAKSETEHNAALKNLIDILLDVRLTKQQRLDIVDCMVSLDANCILTNEDYDKIEGR